MEERHFLEILDREVRTHQSQSDWLIYKRWRSGVGQQNRESYTEFYTESCEKKNIIKCHKEMWLNVKNYPTRCYRKPERHRYWQDMNQKKIVTNYQEKENIFEVKNYNFLLIISDALHPAAILIGSSHSRDNNWWQRWNCCIVQERRNLWSEICNKNVLLNHDSH